MNNPLIFMIYLHRRKIHPLLIEEGDFSFKRVKL